MPKRIDPTKAEEMPGWERFSRLRDEWLALEGRDLLRMQGWLIGVICAMERKARTDPWAADAAMVDQMLAVLRNSKAFI